MASIGFTRLREFLQERMRMAHVYQPLMLRTLLVSVDRRPDETLPQASSRMTKAKWSTTNTSPP